MINERIAAFRKEMLKRHIACYVVTSFDAHQSEYVSPYYKGRAWLSGFTGSAGTLVITQDQALLWTDGRYHVQAQHELSGTCISLVKEGLMGVPTVAEWCARHLEPGATIGFDGKCMSYQMFKRFTSSEKKKHFTYRYDEDVLGEIWTGRPALPKTPLFLLDDVYAGQNRKEKIALVREKMLEKGADSYLIPNLDDIAWLLNIRGEDILFCPFVMAYVWVTGSEVYCFVDPDKVGPDHARQLSADGITLLPYEAVWEVLSLGKEASVLFDPMTASVSLVKAIPSHVQIVEGGDVISRLKAVKNPIEIQNIRKSQVKDGIAMVRFILWLKANLHTISITECDVAKQLEHFRSQQALFKGPSFNTIAAYGHHAAMMHYSASPDHQATLKEKGFLLFDSGGQYLDGTTDITRTLALGPLTDEERQDYTLTLKSHINLAQAVFLEGTCGPHLDVLARKPMWERGLDYKCGTGHGLGFFLSVHEGPHTIRCNQNDIALERGMIMTNEPGVYKPGRHGVRIENTLLVTLDQETEFGVFYRFETLSYCPIDTTPLVKHMMTHEEVSWLNTYHQVVYQELSPHLDPQERMALKDLTDPI